MRNVAGIRAEGPIYMLLFVLNAAAFMALLAMYLRERFDEATTRRALILIGFCTVWLPCSRIDSIEQLTLTFLFAGFLLVRRGAVVPGMLVASISITIRPDSAIAVAILALWYWWPRRRARFGNPARADVGSGTARQRRSQLGTVGHRLRSRLLRRTVQRTIAVRPLRSAFLRR